MVRYRHKEKTAMAQEEALAQLSSLFSGYDHIIAYQPLRTEVDISVFTADHPNIHCIPPRASLDPNSVVESMKAAVGEGVAVVLIPGKRFDASGTRHGQGGGWYDRFLAQVPREWLRIGFCYDDQFSQTPLVRESWDQAMDYVVVVDRKTNAARVYSSEGI